MKTRAITEGALFAAITVITALLSYYIPFMSVLIFFLPVPCVILYQRHGLAAAAVSSGAAILLMLLFMDAVNVITIGLMTAVPGLILGWCYDKKKSGFVRLGAGYLVYLGVFILIILLFQLISGISFMDDYINTLNEASSGVMQIYKESGLLSQDQITNLSSQVDQLMTSFKMMLPACFLIIPFFMSWFTSMLCDYTLRKLRIACIPLTPMYEWCLPNSFKLFSVILMAGTAIITYGFPQVPEIYTYTVIAVMSVLFLLMGYSFIFWLTRIKMSGRGKWIRVLCVILSFMMPVLMTVIMFVGLMDVYMGLRRFFLRKE
ncbi:MAG: YybS family protein [Eubacteriaceae bacterium]